MVAEGSVNVTTFFVLSTLFGVLAKERLLVEGGFTRRDGGRSNGVGRADKWGLSDDGILSCHQEDPEVAVLDLAAGTLG